MYAYFDPAGEADVRVPVTNSYELYRGLKDMGVETEFVVFKGMGYSSEQPGVNMAVMEQNLGWFLKRVLGE
jgi:dipeptidyl aminopeptidase/acylaminoacyl peptidase